MTERISEIMQAVRLLKHLLVDDVDDAWVLNYLFVFWMVIIHMSDGSSLAK